MIFALYDDVKLIEINPQIYSSENIVFTIDKKYINAKVMVWESFNNLKPVINAEIVK